MLGLAARRISFYTETVQRKLAILSAHSSDFVTRFSEIHVHSGRNRELYFFDRENVELLRNQKKSITLRSAFAPSIEWLGFLAFAIFLYLHGQSEGIIDVDPTFLMQFIIALGLCIRPLRNLGEQISKYQETRGALKENFSTFLQSIPDEESVGESQKLINADQEILLNQIVIQYNSETSITATSLKLPPSEDIVISGASGSGKSSLLKGLAGLINPSEWDASISWQEFHCSAAFVSQTPFVFDDTYRTNILYGIKETSITDGEIVELAHQLGLSDVIASPTDLDKPLTSYSAELSGGQKQRLTILRALIQNKPILLLDEATSALDVETEKRVLNFLHQEMRRRKGRLIFVTHREVDDKMFNNTWLAEAGKITAQNG